MSASKPRLAVTAALTGLAVAGILAGIFLYRQNAAAPPPSAPLASGLSRAALEQSALFKIIGVPDDVSIEGEAQIDGALHPLSLLAGIPGQRVFGAENMALANITDYAVTLRLTDARDGKVRDIGWRVTKTDAGYAIEADASGFTAQGAATLSLNGRVAIPRIPLDWNGRITLAHTADKTDVIQIAVVPDEYEAYVVTAGGFLKYYLQDFFHAPEPRHGLPPFSFGEETTDAQSNRLAAQLNTNTGSRALGWWADAQKNALVARYVTNECNARCPTVIYMRDGDTWTPVFSDRINALWADAEKIAQDGSILYTAASGGEDKRWAWQDGRYVLTGAAEDAP